MRTQKPVPKSSDSLAETWVEGAFPTVFARVGKATCFVAQEFFQTRLSNPHTRTKYAHQVGRFLASCEDEGLDRHSVTPSRDDRFLDEFSHRAPTKNQAIEALTRRPRGQTRGSAQSRLFGPRVRHAFAGGRTPEAAVEHARRLLASAKTEHAYGLQDRAVLGTLTYTGIRFRAVYRLWIQDLRNHGKHQALQFADK